MPILQPVTFDTNNITGVGSAGAKPQNVSAKDFFSSRFTGTGKKMGLLNEKTDHPSELIKAQKTWLKKTRNSLTHGVIHYGDQMIRDNPDSIMKKDLRQEGSGEAHFFPLDLTPYGIMERILLSDTSAKTILKKGFILKDNTKYENIHEWHELWSNSKFEIRLRAIPVASVIRIETLYDAKTGKTLTNTCPWFSYSLEFAFKNKNSVAEEILFINSMSGKTVFGKTETEKYSHIIDHYDVEIIPGKLMSYPKDNLRRWLKDLKWIPSDIDIEIATLSANYDEWYAEFSCSKNLRDFSSLQASSGDNLITEFLQDTLSVAKTNKISSDSTVNLLCKWVRMIDSCQGYNKKHLLSNNLLSRLADILSSEEKWLTKEGMYKIFNQSLRLLLAKRLKELNELKTKGKLYPFTAIDQNIKQVYLNSKDWSNQQKAIITSEDPLIIGAAGAGSGKSHTVIGRLSYLKEQGVDMTKVGVFSFTNIAADNIKARYKGIRSETLANMFNEIYQMNYPDQILSQPSTLSHTLQMINPNHKLLSAWPNKDMVKDVIRKLSHDLEQFDQQGYQRVDVQGAFRDLNELLRENLPLIETLLNMCGQTTLELEPAILHIHLQQGMSNIKVPQKYRELNFIITDESQDISTFEYIILLELAIHYHAQLLIVGDGSQTLYEFRNSDPRYINALEGSGIFESKKLDVNFRSSQEILDYANQFLEVIEANDIAQLQLSSNNFSTPTVTSLKEAITICNIDTINKKSESYLIALEDWIKDNKKTQNWILDKIQKGEQIAFLGWSRKEIEVMEKSVEKLLKKNGIPVATKMQDGTWTKGIRGVTLMPKKQNTYTLMSNLLLGASEHLDKIPCDASNNRELKKLFKSFIAYKSCPPGSQKRHTTEIAIERALDRITRKFDPITRTYGDYQDDYKAILRDVQSGKLSKEKYVAHFKQRLITDEINENSVRNYLNGPDATMDEIKSNDPAIKVDLIYSTIHSAKGLEFDNVVISHDNNKRSGHTQEALRLFFVGFSRAKKKELILNGEYKDPYRAKVYSTIGRSGMLVDPINVAYKRCLTNIQNGTRPVSGKLEKDVTEFGMLEDE